MTPSAFSLQPSAWKSLAAARLVAALAFACLLVTACGQKGPLYLPDEAGEVVTRTPTTVEPAPEDAPAETKPEDDESADQPR